MQPSEDATASILTSGIGYPASLTTHVAERANQSQIVQDQLANPEINVFTGRAFGEESSQNEFDINSLFSVDTDALQNAFSFDESALSEGLDSSSLNLEDYINMEGGTADLSGLADLSSISLDLPEFSGLSLGDMMSSISITASQDTLSQDVYKRQLITISPVLRNAFRQTMDPLRNDDKHKVRPQPDHVPDLFPPRIGILDQKI